MTSARYASPAACSDLLPERQATDGGIEQCSASVLSFLAKWIAPQPSRLYINPPRREYGQQYNGVGECPF